MYAKFQQKILNFMAVGAVNCKGVTVNWRKRPRKDWRCQGFVF